MAKSRNLAALLLAFILFPAVATGADAFKGLVVAVADGDTLTVMRGGEKVRIRLAGIDTPERAQAFGAEAGRFTKDATEGKVVGIRPSGRDRYGRIIGDVILPGGRNLNAALVRAGLAWHFKRYSADAELARLEREARADRRGLWSQARPIAPWDFRRGKKE